MSDFSGHIRGGFYAAFICLAIMLPFQILFSSFSWFEFPLFILFSLFGSMWPDSDIGSKSRIYIYMIFVVIDIVLIAVLDYYFEAAVLGLFAMMPAVSKHRGWTHSIKGNILVGLPLMAPSFFGNGFLVDLKVYQYRDLLFFGVPYFAAFLAGAMSHLYLDRASLFKKTCFNAKGKTEKNRKSGMKK